MHLAGWISAVYREEAHGKIQRKVVRYFCEIEHILRKEETEEHFNREAKEGWRLRLIPQESLMKEQAVRIERMCGEESLL